MDVKQLFLTQKASEHQGTLAVYAKIPPDRLDWRPAPDMLSLGQMARHVWRSEEGVRRIALEGDWSYYETRIPQGLLAILGEVKSLDEELQEIRRVHQETLRAAEAFPLERWEEIRENTRFNIRRSSRNRSSAWTRSAQRFGAADDLPRRVVPGRDRRDLRHPGRLGQRQVDADEPDDRPAAAHRRDDRDRRPPHHRPGRPGRAGRRRSGCLVSCSSRARCSAR